MNYLVHLYLSDPEPLVRLGNMMGDFVKGPLEEAPYPPEIIYGLRQHRAVDTLAHLSQTVKTSKNRLDPSCGYFRSIMIDVFYDHFLAANWHSHADLPLEDFARSVYRLLEDHEAILPEGLKIIAPKMIEHNWLVSYRQAELMERALKRLSERLSRPNPLADGYGELLKHYDELKADCAVFLDEARQHLATGQWSGEHCRLDRREASCHCKRP